MYLIIKEYSITSQRASFNTRLMLRPQTDDLTHTQLTHCDSSDSSLNLMKQKLRLRGQKPDSSSVDRFQRVVQNRYLPIVIAEYNVVQFWNVCV